MCDLVDAKCCITSGFDTRPVSNENIVMNRSQTFSVEHSSTSVAHNGIVNDHRKRIPVARESKSIAFVFRDQIVADRCTNASACMVSVVCASKHSIIGVVMNVISFDQRSDATASRRYATVNRTSRANKADASRAVFTDVIVTHSRTIARSGASRCVCT